VEVPVSITSAPLAPKNNLGGSCSNVNVSVCPLSIAEYVALKLDVSAPCSEFERAANLLAGDAELLLEFEVVTVVVDLDVEVGLDDEQAARSKADKPARGRSRRHRLTLVEAQVMVVSLGCGQGYSAQKGSVRLTDIGGFSPRVTSRGLTGR